MKFDKPKINWTWSIKKLKIIHSTTQETKSTKMQQLMQETKNITCSDYVKVRGTAQYNCYSVFFNLN